MFRYVALVWNVTNPSVTNAAELVTSRLRLNSSDCISAFDKDGLRVLCTEHRADKGQSYLLSNDGGIVVGKLFRRNRDPKDDGPPRNPTLDSNDAFAILRTRGRALIDSYWGWYVAFLRDPAGHEKWILRGPMSDLPCFHVVFRGVSIFFSWIEDCAALGLMPFTIDWTYVGLQVAFGASVRIGQTAIAEVSSIAGGECVQIRAESVVKSVYWDPCSVAKTSAIDDPQEAARMLRANVRSCVHAWASDHEALLLRLSGGFDSSVVLWCLRDAPNRPRVTCINYYSSGAMSDERDFARAISHRAGAELVEREFGHEGSLEVIRTVRRTCAPTNDVIDWQENP
jgi:asparagine synthase (glutamine-hydrolysing)